MGRLIGIDLGTANTVAAVVRRDPQVVINEIGSRQTPSIVGFSRKGDRFVGAIAKRQMMVNPDHTIYDIKRFLGRPYEDAWEDLRRVPYPVTRTPTGEVGVTVNARCWSATEIAAMILATIKKSAEEQLSEKVTEAVLAVPAHFSDRQRDALKDAGALAGLGVVRLINEPTAAALAWYTRMHRDAILAIYDFGGATFTLSLVKVDGSGTQILATSSNTHLGGDDLDSRIIQWLIEEFYTEHHFDISTDRTAMQRLKDAAERAKLELASATQTEIRLPFLAVHNDGPKHIQRGLTRQFFETMVDEVFQRTLDECRICLTAAGLKVEDIEEVVLVGGSSRIPRVQELVSGLFGRPISKAFNPEEIIAVGAACQGWLLTGADPAPPATEVTALSLGIEVEDGRFARLIPRNAPLPVEVKRTLAPLSEHQPSVCIHLLQGESPRARENTSLGELELTGLPGDRKGPVPIELTLGVDVDGILTAHAREPRSGVEQRLIITAFAPLIRRRQQAAEVEVDTTDSDVAVDEEVQELRTTLERQVRDLEKLLHDQREQLSPNELREVDAALKRGQMAVVKTGGRAEYFLEISQYIYHFYTNLCKRLGV